MKSILIYAAGVLAFAAGTLSFMAGDTWPGILAVLAGIVAVSSAFVKGDRR